MSLPSEKKNELFTYEDYLTWPEDERWEIIDGIPYMQAAPSRIHQEISVELLTQFNNYLKDKSCKVYHAPFTVRLDDGHKDEKDIRTVVEPDIVVVCDKEKLDDKGCKGVPDLIIEILSSSSAKMDRLIKFNKYEKAGVKEYWIIDPNERIVSVFKLDADRKYKIEMYSDEDKINVGIFQNLIIDLKPVFYS